MKNMYRKVLAIILTAGLVASPLESLGFHFSQTTYAMEQPSKEVSEDLRAGRATDSNAHRQQEADIEEADIEEADVEESDIEETDIEETDIKESDIEETDIKETDTKKTDIKEDNIRRQSATPSEISSDEEFDEESDEEYDEESECNPFDLKDNDMPASYEELFASDENLLSLSMETDAEDTPEVSLRSKPVISGDFVIEYTSVAMKKKKFKVTSSMNPTVNLLTTPHSVQFDDGTYYGFRVISLMVEVTDTENDETLVFYADRIVSGNFYINVRMELGDGKSFTDGLWHTDDVNDESGTWKAYKDATFTSGRFNIKLTQPYGAYVGKVSDTTQSANDNMALIIAQTGDESLETGPEEDAQALKSALMRTGEFCSENVTVMEVPEDTDEDYKTKIWEWIDEAARKDRMTFIAYTGHGNYLDDGTSELSLSGEDGQNTIHAVELKQHVAKLSGKVVLVFDCCFSGGMIMPTTMDTEDGVEQTDVESVIKKAQEKADESLKTFVKDFKNAEVTSEATLEKKASKNLSYYIYAAASSYETSIQKKTGGEMINAFCHALGYDRNDGAYNIYAADINADSNISVGELSDHIKRSCTVATPSIYPVSGSETLFTYDGDDGMPAVISMKTLDNNKNITVSRDNSIKVSVNVKNYSSETVTFDAMMGEAVAAAMDTPGDYDTVAGYSDDKLIYNEGVNQYTLKAKSEGAFTFTFKADKDETVWLKNGGRYLVRIWGTGDTDSTIYAISDFYIGSSEKADAPDPDALELRKPAYANKASEAVEVSAIVPINVAFDREPVEKQGYAACTLTARYFDLGNTDGTVNGEGLGYYAKGGVLMLNDRVFADAQNDSNWSEIYTDVRPTYTRRDILGDGKTTVTGSTYNYEWDVSGLKKGHYYVLQVMCSYDNEPDKKTSVLTFIKVVYPSEQPLHVISEHNISMDDIASDSKGGIAMGGSWLEDNSTVKDATKRLVKYWNSNSYSYDQSNNKAIHYSIEDETAENSSGWYEIAENGTAREMNKNETFKKGNNYVNRLIMQIDSGYNAIFGSWTDVRVGGHSVYDKDGFDRTLSNDKKTLTVYILHKNVGVDDSGFHVYLAGTKTPVTDQTKLTVGDEIDVYKTDGLSLYIGSDSGLKAVSGDYDGFERYRILQNETQIQILLYRELNFKSEDDCACASLLFEHEISDRTDEVDGISAPAKTFYSVGSSSLDLTGSEITLYDEERKGSRMNLDKFLDTYKTKLYYSPDDENYVEWSDDNLNQLGTWQLYVKYNDAYYNAFSIRVGYEQGEYFKLDGKLTDNQSGEANYISDKETKNVVLFVTSSFEATDDKNGVITCEHDLRLKEDGVRAENYKELYPADGATVSYLLPYPDIQDPPFSGNAYDYTIVDADRNVPVSFEKREDGLFVTASRNGEFQIKYFLDIGGDDGGIVVPDEYKDDDDKNDGYEQNADKTYHSRRSGRSSEYSTSVTRTFGVWQSETYNNKLFYRFRMKNGVYATGWRLIYWQGAERWFYFGDDGIMLTGWIMYNGKWYYLNADGDMAIGWIMYNGKWYYLNTDGDMATGWIMYKDKWYYLNADGDMATGWIMYKDKWYYLNADGDMANGWITDNGRQYYLLSDGSLASD